MAKRGQGEGSISKRPDGTWWARITVGKNENGKQKRKAFYGRTRKEVQEQLTAALNEVNQGTYIEPSDMLLETWIMKWLREYKKPALKSTSYRSYTGWIKGYIIPMLGKYPLKDLRSEMVQGLISHMLEQNMSSQSISATVGLLKSSLGQAIKNDLIRKNAASGVVLPAKNQKKRECLTKEEQEAFIAEAEHSYHGEVFMLILATGLRLGEALALTWDDIDFEQHVLHVRKTQIIHKDYDDETPECVLTTNSPKTKSSRRTVPLLSYVVDLLHRIESDRGAYTRSDKVRFRAKHQGGEQTERYVFCNEYGEMLYPNTVRSNFTSILYRSGINKKYTPHCLRHTFATRGLEQGIPMKVMQELLGHANIQMTADQYTHVLPDTKRDYIMKLADSIIL